VQRAVVDYLELDGWRAFRTELTVQREYGRVVGERGQPDYLFLRYGEGFTAEVLWIEFKRPGERPNIAQQMWHKAEKERGAEVLVVDDIQDFRDSYAASGLIRRVRER